MIRNLTMNARRLFALGTLLAWAVFVSPQARGQCPCNADLSPCTPDGSVGVFDMQHVYTCILDQADSCGRPLSVCDVNCDGVVDFCDYGHVVATVLGYPDPCSIPCGACCLTEDPWCIRTTEYACDQSFTGLYKGDGIPCSPDPCEPVCPNGFCEEPDEDQCNCPEDCGTPHPVEYPVATCRDGIDNDCDGLVDCDDWDDCKTDPVCGPYCPNGVCETAVEDKCNCPQDCGTPPTNEVPDSTCNDLIDNDCDGHVDCDDVGDCADDLYCLSSQEWCMIITDAAPLNTHAASDASTDFSPHIVTDGQGTWMTVWSSSYTMGDTIGYDRDILASRSMDRGMTWSDAFVVNTSASTDSGDDGYRYGGPKLAADGQGNWVAIWQSVDTLDGTVGDDYDIFVAYSQNNGDTWSQTALLNTTGYSDHGSNGDIFPHVTTDGQGHWVAIWHSGGTQPEGPGMRVALSTDNGATWSDPIAIAPGGLHSHLTTDRQGNWVATWDSTDDLGGTIGNDYDILYSTSTNNGVTWSEPAFLNSSAPADTSDDSYAHVTPDGNGVWMAAWHSMGASADIDVYFAISTNNGLTWTAADTLNSNADSDSGSDIYPVLTSNGAGHWVAVWQSNEDLAGEISDDTDVLVAYSPNDGEFWTPPALLNTTGAVDAGTPLGDNDLFPHVATDRGGTWVGVWGSTYDLGGTISGDWDILYTRFHLGDEDCNGNGVPDGCDILDETSLDCNNNGIPDECEVPWTLAVNTFDEGIEGWEEYPPEDINIDWEPTGGNPDGFLWTQDDSGRSAMTLAPLEYTGDWSALNGVGIIRYDTMFIYDPDNRPLTGHPYVTLIGPGGKASCVSDLVQPTEWQTFTFPLNGALWNVTEGTWAGLLADVTHLILHADHTTGHDINGFDNIFVGASGEGQDCNENGIPDECDIADGTSPDVNTNGIPDECEYGACCDDLTGVCTDDIVIESCSGRWLDGAVCSTASFDPPCGDVPLISLLPVEPPPETGVTYLPGTVISGNEITIPVGQKVWLDVTLSGWDPDLDGDPTLLAWQVGLDASGYTSGLHGTLNPAQVACTTSADCEAAFGHGAICNDMSYPIPDVCGPGFIDTTRVDWSMASCPQPTLNAVNLWTPDYLFGAVCSDGQMGDSVPDPGIPMYAATVVLDVPEDTEGTFTVALKPHPDSFMVDPDSQFIPSVGTVAAVITTRLASCCLPEGDCIETTPSDCAESEGTIVETCLGDGDGDGTDDACQCPAPLPPEPEILDLPELFYPVSQKVRYLSFSAGEPETIQGVRVTLVSMPAPYTHWNGTQLWVQEPEVYCENAGVSQETPCPSATGGLPQNWFWGAELGCDPYWTDWTQYDLVHVWHEGIVPDGTYDLQAIYNTCSTNDESAYSPPLILTQSIWGDLVEDCSTAPCKPPDGSPGMVDVTAILDKWKNLSGNVIKARADIEGSPAGDHRIPDQSINITDVTYCLGAYLGQTYPPPGFPPPSDPPACP